MSQSYSPTKEFQLNVSQLYDTAFLTSNKREIMWSVLTFEDILGFFHCLTLLFSLAADLFALSNSYIDISTKVIQPRRFQGGHF